jgi:hypothetical protein
VKILPAAQARLIRMAAADHHAEVLFDDKSTVEIFEARGCRVSPEGTLSGAGLDCGVVGLDALSEILGKLWVERHGGKILTLLQLGEMFGKGDGRNVMVERQTVALGARIVGRIAPAPIEAGHAAELGEAVVGVGAKYGHGTLVAGAAGDEGALIFPTCGNDYSVGLHVQGGIEDGFGLEGLSVRS